MQLHSNNGNEYSLFMITEKNISDYISNIPSYFSKLLPAHQADFIRVNVICKYGGIWLDADTIVLDSLGSLFDYINSGNGFFIKENNKNICNGVFGSKPNTPLMIKWRNDMMNILKHKEQNIHWTEIGSDILEEINHRDADLFSQYHIFDGLNNMCPVNWKDCVYEYIDQNYENYTKIVRDYQPLIILVQAVYKKLENKTEAEILEDKMPINYFITKSFENLKGKN
jgi:hypothetical protein